MGPFKVFLDHPNEKSVTATSINLDLLTSEPHFVFQISFLPNIQCVHLVLLKSICLLLVLESNL